MKDRYKYKSEWLAIYLFFSIPIMWFLILVLGEINVFFGMFMFFVLLAVEIYILLLLQAMPAEINACESSVEFKLLHKKINIQYSDIENIEVTHEYVKPQIRGDQAHYDEIIKFVCKSGEYCFRNNMEELDLGQTARNPESLEEQFKYGTFMRLKNYISEQTGVIY